MQIIMTPFYSDNYAYVLIHDHEAVVIDPGKAKPVLQVLEKNEVECVTILNTHNHSDHVGGNLEILKSYSGKVLGRDPDIPGLSVILKDGDLLELGDFTFNVLYTPGHTMNDICFYIPPLKGPGLLWSGDVLFHGGCGRVFSSNYSLMWQSLERIKDLPNDTLVYSGHDYAIDNFRFACASDPENSRLRVQLEQLEKMKKEGHTAIPFHLGKEKITNPFLRSGSLETFCSLRIKKNAFQI